MVTDCVFHRNGYTLGDFKKAWASARGRAGLPGILFHDLRRSAARSLVRSGVSETVAMSVTGHKIRSVFGRYTITSGADQKKALRAVSV